MGEGSETIIAAIGVWRPSEASMGARFLRAILQFIILASPGLAIAQGPAANLLPDAPRPITDAITERPESAPVGPEIDRQEPLPTALSARQKYALAYRRIVSPQLPMKAAFVSGCELATGTGKDFPTNGWGPFAERFGYNAATISTTIFFNTAFVPAIVHQDPRYFPLKRGPVKTRIWWAVRSEFVGFGDDGHEMPNYANLMGFALSSIAANAYPPRSDVSFDNTVKSYAIKISVSTGLNVAREFGAFDRAKAIVHHSKSANE